MLCIEKAKHLRKIIEKAVEFIDDKTSTEVIELFPMLKNDGSLIKAGTRINYNGIIKKAAVDLYDIETNNPNNAPTLWEDILYKEGIRIIPSLVTVTSKFSKGELGWWNDTLYESLLDNNVYTPNEYPQGWKKTRKEEINESIY